MTPDELARIHRAAFAPDRGWSAEEFSTLLSSDLVSVFAAPAGFALIRVVAGEAELLTLAVDPQHQRSGMADTLMQNWMTAANAKEAFLEVAEDNHAAQSLYRKHGFVTVSRRTGYYVRPNAKDVDALLMRASLHPRNAPQIPQIS